MKSFIQDTERVLDSANDLLKTSVYAENLVKVIENTPKDKVFTIGVFGGWGTGKSSIIRTAQEKIEKEQSNVKFITYDAWKYANDSFRRMFLLKVQQELKMRQTEEMSRFYQSETAEQEPKTKLSTRGLVLVNIILLFLLGLLWVCPLELKWKACITSLGTLFSLMITLWNGCFYELKLTITKPALFAPEQFEECFKQMMSKCLKDTSWIKRKWEDFRDYVEVGEISIKGLEKLVIVIDNIDRCPSDMSYQLLTDIKTFLSNEDYNIVFVVPVDDEALKKHLFRKLDEKNGYNIDKEKEEFLRKFFNVTLRIKPHQETELLYFTHEINKENHLGYSNDTLSIVAKEFADNPRRIIQLLNNLSSDLTLYDDEDDFAKKYETAICIALILHEEYPTFFKKAAKNFILVSNFNREFAKEKDDKVNESLVAFMRVADLTLKHTPLIALQRILTNTTSIFSDLPAEIQKSVTTYDAAKVIEFAKNNGELKTKLVDFALERVSIEVKYGATSQTTNWIDFLSQLFKAGVFDSSRFYTINSVLSNYYKVAIPVIQDQEALCNMGSQMAIVGIKSLRSAIIEYLTADKAKENANFDNVLHAYFSNFRSEQDCKDIATVVENYYIDNTINDDIDFTEAQKKIFFGDPFVAKEIENITATNDRSRLNDVVWCIKNNSELSSETFIALFAKFIELFGNTRAKSKEDFLTFISHLQNLFDALPSQSLTNELADVYNVVVNTRAIPHPSWPTHTQHDSHRSILDEVNTEEAKVVTTFCYEVMRISGGCVDISVSISKLYTKCKDAVVEGALKIHSMGISIASLAGTLIQADNYDSAKNLLLLEIIMSPQLDGSFVPDDATVKEKIHTLVDNANNNGVEKLLGKLVNDKKILDMVAEYVASLDSKTINGLPVSIARHAVKTFKRENAETYKDNADFLILVLRQGTAAQKREVVRLMKDKINNERNLDDVVKVLSNLDTEDQRMLKNLIGELEEIKDSETVNDETKALVADLVAKLSGSIKKKSVLNKLLGKN